MGDSDALYVTGDSDIRFRGQFVHFISNTAGGYGCAAAARGEYFVPLFGNMLSSNSTSGGFGGAFDALDDVASWDGDTLFSQNFAKSGGALSFRVTCIVSWNGKTIFSRNHAMDFGGAFFLHYSSIASWDGETEFAKN